jgi:uncharacterized membrane protein
MGRPMYFGKTLMQTMLMISNDHISTSTYIFMLGFMRNNPPLVSLIVTQNIVHFLIAHVWLFSFENFSLKLLNLIF